MSIAAVYPSCSQLPRAARRDCSTRGREKAVLLSELAAASCHPGSN